MKRLSPRVLALVTCSALFAGCATLSDTGGLSVSVTHVQPTEASLFETVADLTVRLTNETPRPLALAGSTHRLYFNGTSVGRAVSNQRVSGPDLGTVTQTVTVHLENLPLIRKVTELAQTEAPRISYRLDSVLHPAEGQGYGSFRTTSTGELDLSSLAMPTSVAAKRDAPMREAP